MELTLYQIDAFASRVFGGNPAAVCPLEAWLPDRLLQSIAAENNLSETAFFVPEDGGFALRWFTPRAEIDLCGHATLATAHAVFEFLGYAGETVRFSTLSGPLLVTRQGGLLAMDFPAWEARPLDPPEALSAGLGQCPAQTYANRDILAVLPAARDVRDLAPDLARLAELRTVCIVATAPGEAGGPYDFVSRVFVPSMGIPEDPVTGSAHCTLVPYWAARLGKTVLRAFQASARGGELLCELKGDRVSMAGPAACYLKGTIFVEA